MIIKLQSINYLRNSLAYCEKGGKLLYSNLCFGNHNEIYHQMKAHEALNSKCKKKTFHIKLRTAPEDHRKLKISDWLEIAKSYAKKIGFENNLYAIYLHKENSAEEHLHIISSRIKDNNLAVSDSFTHYKNMDFSRTVEKKYNLRKVKRVLETLKAGEVFKSESIRAKDIETAIEESIEISDDMDDFIFHLMSRNIELKRKGGGISFIDSNGVSIKGSKINRKYSLKGLEKLFSYANREKQEIIKSRKI